MLSAAKFIFNASILQYLPSPICIQIDRPSTGRTAARNARVLG
jgi:hypothetical protein